MRILLLSDTHDSLEKAMEVYKKLRAEAPLDYIVHCGDFYEDAMEIKARTGANVIAVKGNCDGCHSRDEHKILETEAGDFFICHGNAFDVSFSQQTLYYNASDKGCIGAVFGHTHRGVFADINGFYMINPGSISKPRDGSSGTFGLLITSDNEVWCKIYDYDLFMADAKTAGAVAKGGGGSGGNGWNGGKKAKVQGGHLRELINYSDRF